MTRRGSRLAVCTQPRNWGQFYVRETPVSRQPQHFLQPHLGAAQWRPPRKQKPRARMGGGEPKLRQSTADNFRRYGKRDAGYQAPSDKYDMNKKEPFLFVFYILTDLPFTVKFLQSIFLKNYILAKIS